jgi:hypothetical protein
MKGLKEKIINFDQSARNSRTDLQIIEIFKHTNMNLWKFIEQLYSWQ